MNFWIVSGLLSLLASLFIIVPYIYLRKSEHTENFADDYPQRQEKENVAIYKERLSELEKELASELIDHEQFSQRKNELDIALLNDVRSQTTTEPSKLKSFSLVPVFLGSIIFLVGFSFWLYFSNGAFQDVKQFQTMNFEAQELQKAKKLAQDGDMSALLSQLHKKLQAAPDNIEGWQLLARSAMNVQDYVLAVTAYKEIARIYRENNQNPAPILGLLAQARYYEANGALTTEVRGLIEEALSLDSNELNSIGLLAIDAFSSKRFEEAKANWLKILSIYPEHPARPSIEAGIQRVNAELGLPPEVFASNSLDQANENLSSTNNSALVHVRVSLADSLRDKVKPEDTVFVIAKQVKGNVQNPNIPLAVSRHTVADLPIEVVLDDTKSMAPIAKLSLSETVVIIARVSSSGNPIAQSGDFEAVSADISVTAQEKVDLMIQSELK